MKNHNSSGISDSAAGIHNFNFNGRDNFNRKANFDEYLKEHYSSMAAKYTFLTGSQIRKRVLNMWKKVANPPGNSDKTSKYYKENKPPSSVSRSSSKIKNHQSDALKPVRSLSKGKCLVPLKIDFFPAPLKGVLKSTNGQSKERRVSFNNEPAIHYCTASDTSSDGKRNYRAYSSKLFQNTKKYIGKSKTEKKFDELCSSDKCSWSYKTVKSIESHTLTNKENKCLLKIESTIGTLKTGSGSHLCMAMSHSHSSESNYSDEDKSNTDKHDNKKSPRQEETSKIKVFHYGKSALDQSSPIGKSKGKSNTYIEDYQETRNLGQSLLKSYVDCDAESIQSSSDDGVILQSRILRRESSDGLTHSNSNYSDDDLLFNKKSGGLNEELDIFFNSGNNCKLSEKKNEAGLCEKASAASSNYDVDKQGNENSVSSSASSLNEEGPCKKASELGSHHHLNKQCNENPFSSFETSLNEVRRKYELSIDEDANFEKSMTIENDENYSNRIDPQSEIAQKYAEIPTVCNESESPKCLSDDEVAFDFFNGTLDPEKYKVKSDKMLNNINVENDESGTVISCSQNSNEEKSNRSNRKRFFTTHTPKIDIYSRKAGKKSSKESTWKKNIRNSKTPIKSKETKSFQVEDIVSTHEKKQNSKKNKKLSSDSEDIGKAPIRNLTDNSLNKQNTKALQDNCESKQNFKLSEDLNNDNINWDFNFIEETGDENEYKVEINDEKVSKSSEKFVEGNEKTQLKFIGQNGSHSTSQKSVNRETNETTKNFLNKPDVKNKPGISLEFSMSQDVAEDSIFDTSEEDYYGLVDEEKDVVTENVKEVKCKMDKNDNTISFLKNSQLDKAKKTAAWNANGRTDEKNEASEKQPGKSSKQSEPKTKANKRNNTRKNINERIQDIDASLKRKRTKITKEKAAGQEKPKNKLIKKLNTWEELETVGLLDNVTDVFETSSAEQEEKALYSENDADDEMCEDNKSDKILMNDSEDEDNNKRLVAFDEPQIYYEKQLTNSTPSFTKYKNNPDSDLESPNAAMINRVLANMNKCVLPYITACQKTTQKPWAEDHEESPRSPILTEYSYSVQSTILYKSKKMIKNSKQNASISKNEVEKEKSGKTVAGKYVNYNAEEKCILNDSDTNAKYLSENTSQLIPKYLSKNNKDKILNGQKNQNDYDTLLTTLNVNTNFVEIEEDEDSDSTKCLQNNIQKKDKLVNLDGSDECDQETNIKKTSGYFKTKYTEKKQYNLRKRKHDSEKIAMLPKGKNKDGEQKNNLKNGNLHKGMKGKKLEVKEKNTSQNYKIELNRNGSSQAGKKSTFQANAGRGTNFTRKLKTEMSVDSISDVGESVENVVECSYDSDKSTADVYDEETIPLERNIAQGEFKNHSKMYIKRELSDTERILPIKRLPVATKENCDKPGTKELNEFLGRRQYNQQNSSNSQHSNEQTMTGIAKKTETKEAYKKYLERLFKNTELSENDWMLKTPNQSLVKESQDSGKRVTEDLFLITDSDSDDYEPSQKKAAGILNDLFND